MGVTEGPSSSSTRWLTSHGSSEPKLWSPLNGYHIKHCPKPSLTYVRSGTNNMILLHHYRLHALFIHTK